MNSHRAKASAYLADAVALFDEKEALASTMARRTFRKGEILAEQGAVLKSLIIVRSGVAAVVRSPGRSPPASLASSPASAPSKCRVWVVYGSPKAMLTRKGH